MKLEKKEGKYFEKEKIFVVKEKKNGEGKEKILDQVYTVRD